MRLVEGIVFWYLGRHRWSRRRRDIAGQRARLGMTGGVGLSVTQRSNGIFLFSEMDE